MNLRLPPRAAPGAMRTTIRHPDEIPAPHSPRAMLMLNYQTNARNGALVRFNPPVRSRRAPRPASPRLPSIPLPSPHHPAGCPSAHFQALTILPSPPSRLRPQPCFISHPTSTSARHHAQFRAPLASSPSPCSVSCPPSSAFPLLLVSRPPLPSPPGTMLGLADPRRICVAAMLDFRGAATSPASRPCLVRLPPRSAAPFGSKATVPV